MGVTTFRLLKCRYAFMPVPKNYYIDPNVFREEIIICKEENELTPKMVNMFILMCNEVAKTRMYRFEQDREDCVAFAIEDCLRYWRSYNPEKSSYAFAYFTRLVMNGLQKGWNKLHKLQFRNKVSISHPNLYNV